MNNQELTAHAAPPAADDTTPPSPGVKDDGTKTEEYPWRNRRIDIPAQDDTTDTATNSTESAAKSTPLSVAEITDMVKKVFETLGASQPNGAYLSALKVELKRLHGIECDSPKTVDNDYSFLTIPQRCVIGFKPVKKLSQTHVKTFMEVTKGQENLERLIVTSLVGKTFPAVPDATFEVKRIDSGGVEDDSLLRPTQCTPEPPLWIYKLDSP
ncbi:hypothetical protein P43SY_000669 [Pythium insidiosum]|uniref:Uncharacterized protein n=1 Tax=Pythium insidiosum TaxID=114742 RepID=A0AAD5QCC7_PYTIN|nr:hypothetical protein P43SY_000669 [Pythium insidiosum]